MGWTGIWLGSNQFMRGKTVDRKAILDHEISSLERESGYQLVKSAMDGAVYYAAVKRPDGGVYGLVCETSVKHEYGGRPTFYYKEISESMGPNRYDCPPSILKLLSPIDPADNVFASEWRERCWKTANKKKVLSKLPIGSRIRFSLFEGAGEEEFEKYPPSFQFKRPFWYNQSTGTCIRVSRIPENFQVVEGDSV